MVKWALGSIITNKASGSDRIPAEQFQILKDDAVKVLTLNMRANLENSVLATVLEKVSSHSNSKRQWQRKFKLPHNCTYLKFCTHLKVMLKSLQARLHQYVKQEILDVQGGFRKGRETRNQIANICWIIEKARDFQKNIQLLLHSLC